MVKYNGERHGASQTIILASQADMLEVSQSIMRKNDLDLNTIDWFVPHQANVLSSTFENRVAWFSNKG